jgi:hypothetical protein
MAPGLRYILIDNIIRFEPVVMRYRHEEGHYHAYAGKYNMKSERQGHLGAGGYKVIHRFTIWAMVVRGDPRVVGSAKLPPRGEYFTI